jgi:hypothetical protein
MQRPYKKQMKRRGEACFALEARINSRPFTNHPDFAFAPKPSCGLRARFKGSGYNPGTVQNLCAYCIAGSRRLS